MEVTNFDYGDFKPDLAPPCKSGDIGEALSARDALITGTAYGLEERLAVADADFEVSGLTERHPIDFV